jgi:hypothetical protein
VKGGIIYSESLNGVPTARHWHKIADRPFDNLIVVSRNSSLHLDAWGTVTDGDHHRESASRN